MSSFNFRTMKAGDQIEGIFCLSKKTPAKTRANATYYIITIGNETGTADVRVWNDKIHLVDAVDPIRAVYFTGKVEEYQGRPQVTFLSIEDRGTEHPVIAGNRMCPIPVEVLDARYQAIRERITGPYAAFLDAFFEVGCPFEDFRTAPAAFKHHHAYIHGLYEHSIQLSEIALGMADTPLFRGRVDISLLLAGTLIHDSGKAIEYEWKGVPIRMSEAGLFGSHIAYGPEQVAQTFALRRAELEAAGFGMREMRLLQHIQQSHHGTREMGALLEPRFVEAMLIHQADMVSAQGTSMFDAAELGLPTAHAGWLAGDRPYYNLYVTRPGVAAEGTPTEPTDPYEAVIAEGLFAGAQP